MTEVKKKFSTVVLLGLLAAPLTAFASSYSTWYSFDTTLTGQTRYYDGQNIEFVLDSTSQINGTWTAYLYRDVSWGPDDKIGYGYAPYNGATIIQFSNVGPGNYYSYFTKPSDGFTIDGDALFQNY